MEQKQIQQHNDNEEKSEYQVFELNGVKLDYFDLGLALHGISSEILYLQDLLRNNPNLEVASYKNSMLHITESKLRIILSKMERPPENQIRPPE